MVSNGETEHLFVGFNGNASSLQVGMHSGYAIYDLRSLDKIQQVYVNNDGEAVRYVERLFSACFVAYVLRKSPRKINAFHLEKRRKFCTQCYANTVVTIKMNREYFVACLDDSVIIHTIPDFKVSHQICDIPENKKGIIDITTDGVSMIAYPGAAETGRVSIFDLARSAPSLSICAHTSPLAALRFNPDGKFLATSSVKGTVIRIFNVQTAERCYEFTRGLKRYVTVNCMGFSENSKYLCLSSNTETVHVFKLEESVSDIQPQYETSSWTDYFAKAASSYLPTQVNELISREKSFATARLPKAGVKNVAALRIIKSELYLMVATADGFLYCFVVDPNGGECAIKFQHRIGNEISSAPNNMNTVDESSSTPNAANDMDKVDDVDVSNLQQFPPLDHSV